MSVWREQVNNSNGNGVFCISFTLYVIIVKSLNNFSFILFHIGNKNKRLNYLLYLFLVKDEEELGEELTRQNFIILMLQSIFIGQHMAQAVVFQYLLLIKRENIITTYDHCRDFISHINIINYRNNILHWIIVLLDILFLTCHW